MNEPRAPDNQKNWEAIDIYLFSNGQQYTPPRKYHLRSEELNWWDATLGYLARSQYGSMHKSVVLHTIDGLKIGSPMELHDGVAYVAVIPPDTFIQAGYENYLIKASRSWEKRQKKSFQGEQAGFADTTTVERDQTDHTELNNVPEQNSNTQIVGMIKSASPSQQRKKHLPRIPVSTTKTSEKRKFNSAQAFQRSSIPNKQLRDPAPPPLIPRKNVDSRRESERQESEKNIGLKDNEKKENQRKSFEKRAGVRKESEVRQYERHEREKKEDEKKEIDKKPGERKERLPSDDDRRESKKGLIKEISKKIFHKSHDEGLLKTNNKSIEKGNVNTISEPKQKEIIGPTKLDHGVSETKIPYTAQSVIPHHKSQITENYEVKDVINDKELIVVANLYKNTDSEEGSTCVDPDNVLITLHAHKEKLKSERKSLEPLTKEKTFVKRNSNKQDTSIKYPISSENYHALAISPIETPTKDLKAQDNPTNDQLINVQSKTIPKQNVQDFDISEIKFTNDTEKNPIKDLVTVVPANAEADNLKLTLDARKSEDTKLRNEVQKSLSFVDLRQESEKVKVTQSKSVQSLTNVCPPHICCQRNQKVVVLPCACCDYSPQENGSKREQPQFGTDFNNYFILLPVTGPGCLGKQCCRSCCQKDINTAEKKVQNTESLITELNCQEVTTYPGSKTNAELKMKEIILTSTVSVVKSNSHHSLNTANRESALVAINNVPQTDSVRLKRDSFKSSPALCDKSVQTDWCNIMLEVRKHDDGHYTFHLPSLEVLKSHNVS